MHLSVSEMPDNNEKNRIKRLQERFKRDAQEAFDQHELLELLLICAGQRRDIGTTVADLLARFNGISGVLEAVGEEMAAVRGIHEGIPSLIRVIKKTAEICIRENSCDRVAVNCKKDLIAYLNATILNGMSEGFLAVFLNSRNEILSVELIHEGPASRTAIQPRKAIEPAFRCGAHSVIYVQKRPGQNASPSREDRLIFKSLELAAIAVDMLMLDYIIMGTKRHFSAKENGWITLNLRSMLKTAEP